MSNTNNYETRVLNNPSEIRNHPGSRTPSTTTSTTLSTKQPPKK